MNQADRFDLIMAAWKADPRIPVLEPITERVVGVGENVVTSRPAITTESEPEPCPCCGNIYDHHRYPCV